MKLIDYWKTISSEQNPDKRRQLFDDFFNDEECAETTSTRSEVWWGLALQGATDVWSVIRKACVPRTKPTSIEHARFIWQLVPTMQTMVTGKDWFKCEGIALLLKSLFGTPDSVALLRDAAGASFTQRMHDILHKVALPMIAHKQLAVRSAATQVLPLVIACFESAEERSEHESIVGEWARIQLQPGSEVHAVEGGLQTLLLFPRLCKEFCTNHKETTLRLCSHEAATVRQLVAELLGGPNGGTLEELVEAALHCAMEETSNTWAAIEATLMALNTRTLYTLKGATAGSVAQQVVFQDHAQNCIDLLRAMIKWQRSTKFEVKRMASQELPLFTQLLVRCGNAAVKPIMHLCNEKDLGWTDDERARFVTDVCWFIVLSDLLEKKAAEPTTLDTINAPSATAQVVMTTYNIQADSTGKNVTHAVWKEALHKDAEVARFAPDCAAICSNAWETIPVWAETITKVHQPHIQCLLIEAIRISLAASTAHPMFHFLSHDDFAPPILEEDGDVTSGRSWLMANKSRIPKLKSTVGDASHQEKRLDLVRGNQHIIDSLSKILAQTLPKTATEPSVVTRVLDLAMDLSDLGIVLPQEVFAHVMERLNVVSPAWKTGSFEKIQQPSSTNFDSSDDDDWDATDDDEDDGANGAVAAISIDEEFTKAQRVVKTLTSRGCNLGDSFQMEIDIILRYGSPTTVPK